MTGGFLLDLDQMVEVELVPAKLMSVALETLQAMPLESPFLS